jgi:hypothetical protein
MIIVLRRMGWAEQVAGMGGKRASCRVLLGKCDETTWKT